MNIKINIKDNALMPVYSHPGDAGMDLCAAEDITISPGETVLISVGFSLEIPVGYEAQIRPRSGLSLNTPLRVANAPGTIDSGYRGEVCVVMQNTSERYYTDGIGKVKLMPDMPVNHHLISVKGNRKGWYDIKKGDRIAQMVFSKVETVDLVTSDALEESERADGGFGSTGCRML